MLQRETGWHTVNLVLRCCIESSSTKGFCGVCAESFRHRSGPYYEGFEYPSDEELLTRISSGLKPLATFARRKRDLKLEEQIEKHGLFLVRKYRNQWGVIQYDVVKDPRLSLSDLADTSTISELIDFKIKDCSLIDIPKLQQKIYQGLMYGYPFYTLTREDYV